MYLVGFYYQVQVSNTCCKAQYEKRKTYKLCSLCFRGKRTTLSLVSINVCFNVIRNIDWHFLCRDIIDASHFIISTSTTERFTAKKMGLINMIIYIHLQVFIITNMKRNEKQHKYLLKFINNSSSLSISDFNFPTFIRLVTVWGINTDSFIKST